MVNTRIKGIVIIVLIIIILLLTLGYLSYPIREGITAQEIKDEANAAADAKIQAAKPQSIIKPFKYDVTISDTKDYSAPPLTEQQKLMELKGVVIPRVIIPKFIDKYPESTYLITSVSEEDPTQNTVRGEFKLGKTTTVTLPTETSIFNNFYAIAPKLGSTFPEKFSLNLTNKADENSGVSVFLWGDITNLTSIPKNIVIGPDDIFSTLYDKDPEKPKVFSKEPPSRSPVSESSGCCIGAYPECGTFGELMAYSDTLCSRPRPQQLMVGGFNIGQNALNIYGQGKIHRENALIGSVDASTNIIRLNCTDSKDITGILIYMGHPSK